VQLGHDDLGRRDPLLAVDAGRDAAPVVTHGDGAIGVERHPDVTSVAGERLVDGVVDHLIDHVVQARTVVGVADIHARPLAHGVEALEHLDRVGAVFGRGFILGLVFGFLAHLVIPLCPGRRSPCGPRSRDP
jgi:hypothetical protein